MATWVGVNRAAKFPEVIKVYQRAGGGQGGTETAAKGFLNYVRKLVQDASNGLAPGMPAWIRLNPQAATAGNVGWQNAQVDVTNIPGVRALMQNGKAAGFAPL
jgi:hypothetical protein